VFLQPYLPIWTRGSTAKAPIGQLLRQFAV
jgi:hypothetical protein